MPDPVRPESPAADALVAVADAYLAGDSARRAVDHAGRVGATTVAAARTHRGVARAATRAQERVQRAGGAMRDAEERWLTLLRVYADELGVRGTELIELVEGRRLVGTARQIAGGLSALRESLALLGTRPGPLPAALSDAAAALDRLLDATGALAPLDRRVSPPLPPPPPPSAGAGTPPRR